MKLTHLYLIVFPQKSIFKIGKANDIHNRIHSLKAYWGDPDLDQSYYVVADENLVFRIELALKNILLGYKYECDDGDGKTEIFDIEALDIALKHLDIFLQSPVAEKLVIQKGIKQKFTNTKTQVKRKTLSAIRKNKKFRESFQNASEKILKLHRIINFLNRYGDRIKYQYDILDGYVYFRILKEGKSANLDIIEIRSLFTFGIDDYTETLGGNDCSFTGIDNLIQFKIKAYEEKECSPPSFINYARSQFLCAIKRLANKSEALDKDLEIIDEEAFCERMALSLFNYEFI